MSTINDVREHFIDALSREEFVVSRDGSLTIEMLGASFVADEPAIFGEPNEAYIQAELEWYASESLNINDIYTDGRDAPAAWRMTANPEGEINSNYGALVFGDANGNQAARVVQELRANPLSRRASMVYQRPSIWDDYSANGKNDFICTNAVTYYVRDNRLNCVVQMRSNDVIFGYRNDYAWQQYMLDNVVTALNLYDNQYVTGDIHWQVQNLHVYERHFNKVTKV